MKKTKFTCLRKALAAAVLLAGAGIASAEPKALLIGVGEYADSRANLPGIDLDVNIMREVAVKLGFKKSQILVLENNQVTRSGVERAFAEHFRNVGPDDQVLIYFSGHGSQLPDNNGDEADGFDETLTLYELGQPGQKDQGMLRDDDLNVLLQNIRSDRKMLIVDACCSGTTVKSASFGGKTSRFKVKSSNCPAALAGKGGFLDKAAGVQGRGALDGLVYLSAAQDTEEALASPDGSIFTLGVRQAVRQDPQITPAKLLQLTTQYIEDTVTEPASRFRPNLVGDNQLVGKPIYVTGQRPQPVQRDVWADIVNNADGNLELFASDMNFQAGEQIRLNIEMPFRGYLNIVSIDSQDNATVMYPNNFSPETIVRQPPLVTMPEARFKWVAQAPYGATRFVAIATREPLNLFADSVDYDKSGNPFHDFISPAPRSMRGMCRVNCGQSAKPADRIAYSAGQIVLNTCSGGC